MSGNMDKQKILVVDDEPHNVELICSYLEEEYDIITACNGVEALDKVESSSPDLILLDVMMPEMNGYQVCNKLKKSEKTRFIPVVMVTSLGDIKDREKGINAGADDFINKPVDFDELILRVKSLLRMKQYHDLLVSANRKILDVAEKKYRNLFDNANDGIILTDLDGTITSWNLASEKMFGWNPEEAIGQNVMSLLVPNDGLEDFKKIIHKVLEGGTVSVLELSCRHKGDTKFDAGLTVSTLKDENDNIIGMSGIVRDITERKWAWRALQESELKYRDLFENANDAIFIIDSNLRCRDVNKKALDMLGYSKDDLLSLRIPDLIPSEQSGISKLEFDKLREDGFYDGFVGKIQRKDRSLIDIEVSSSDIKSENKLIGSRNIIRNITERMKYEEELRSSLDEKVVLLREIHHRVKNNMQVISSLLSLQSRHIDDEKYLDIFKESQNRINIMSLVYEKIYRSTDVTNVDLKGYIKDLGNMLLQSYETDSSRIVLNINVVNVSVNVDFAVPLALVINELITNCIKHAFPDGRKGEIDLNINKDNNEYILTVSDNGVGISDNIDFEKTDTMGLSLVRILAENQLRGSIKINRDKGTEFEIRFKGG